MALGKLHNHMQKNETGPFPYTMQKINSEWMKNLDVRHESIKIVEENIGSNLFNIGHSNFFHDMSPKARETKQK